MSSGIGKTDPHVVPGGCTDPSPPAAEQACPHSDCGNVNPPHARFCRRCGRPLASPGRAEALPSDWVIHPISIISTLFLVAAVAVIFAGGSWPWALPFFGVFAFGRRWGRSRRNLNRRRRRF